MKARHTFLATGLVALLALAGVTAAIAADPAGDPPPRIAFLANGIVPADALAAGPIAGQLGAPVFTTPAETLSAEAAEGLDDHNPELVIVLGGPVAINDAVLAQVSAVTGLAIQDPDSRPDSGIVRAAGENRFETAQVVAQLLGDYDPAYLGVDVMAKDSDLLDGKDSTAFQPAGDYLGKTEKAADSDKLDGMPASSFVPNVDIQHGYTSDSDSSTAGTDVDIVTVTINPGDPCGGGGTSWTYIAESSGSIRDSSGAEGFRATVAILIEGESNSGFSNQGFTKVGINSDTSATGFPIIPFSVQRLLEGIAPGGQDVRVTLSNNGGDSVDALYTGLIARPLGYVCS